MNVPPSALLSFSLFACSPVGSSRALSSSSVGLDRALLVLVRAHAIGFFIWALQEVDNFCQAFKRQVNPHMSPIPRILYLA